jgi:hypothetical protein
VEFGGMVAWEPGFLRAMLYPCHFFCVACVARLFLVAPGVPWHQFALIMDQLTAL